MVSGKASLDERIVSKDEYHNYLKGKLNTQIHRIWVELVTEMKENFRKEAIEKGFKVRVISRSLDLITLQLSIPDASKELKNELANLYPIIICE